MQAMAPGNKVALQAGQTLGADTGGTDSARAFNLGAAGTGGGGRAGLEEIDRGAGGDFWGVETAGGGGVAAGAARVSTPPPPGRRRGPGANHPGPFRLRHTTFLS